MAAHAGRGRMDGAAEFGGIFMRTSLLAGHLPLFGWKYAHLIGSRAFAAARLQRENLFTAERPFAQGSKPPLVIAHYAAKAVSNSVLVPKTASESIGGFLEKFLPLLFSPDLLRDFQKRPGYSCIPLWQTPTSAESPLKFRYNLSTGKSALQEILAALRATGARNGRCVRKSC